MYQDCCAVGSGWKSPLLSVWQPLRGKTSRICCLPKGRGAGFKWKWRKVTAVLETCLKSCFAGMRQETECVRSQGLNPFLCMALLPNKHSGLISSCYLHRFARYALPCSCYLLCGLQAWAAQQIKQHSSSRAGHSSRSAVMDTPKPPCPVYLQWDKRLLPARPCTVGGRDQPGLVRGTRRVSRGWRGGEGGRAEAEEQRGSAAPFCSVPALWAHSWTSSLRPKLLAGRRMKRPEGGLVFGPLLALLAASSSPQEVPCRWGISALQQKTKLETNWLMTHCPWRYLFHVNKCTQRQLLELRSQTLKTLRKRQK